MTKEKTLIEFNEDGSTSLNFPDFGASKFHCMSDIQYASRRGLRNANNYKLETLSQMLASNSLPDVYEALTVIGIRKIKSFLPKVYNLAIYDEDVSIKTEAIVTINTIGGKKAKRILKSLRNSEFKELIEQLSGK